MSICRNQKHPKFRLVWTVIKTPSSQTCQVPLWKMSNKAQKQRQAFWFLVGCCTRDAGLGWRGHIPSQPRGMNASSVGSEWTLLIYTSHAPDLQHICYEIAVKKRLSEQMTPQLLHNGHHPAMCTHTHTSHHLLALENCLPVTIGYDWGPGTLAPKSAEVGLVILAFMSSNPPANDAMAEYSVAWKKKQKAF